MSYKVKPEDVPAELINAGEDVFGLHVDLWRCESGCKGIADIIKLAIDLGLVSPPCWAMRNCNGELVTHQRVYTSREAAEDGLRYRYTVEHWKGQTE